MAKNKIQIDVKVDDKGGTKKLGVESKKTAKNLDKVGSSARTVDRNVKGAAQASSSGTKNFSKMAQGAGGLVGVYATLAATAFAVSAAFNFLKASMDFKNLLEGQKALGAVTGVAYKSITSAVIEATNGQLKYADAAKAAAIGTASGISPDQLNRLGAAAKNASLALGRDLGDSFDRLIRGVTKAEPELLDELGIILRLENATRKYGQQIGKSKDQLNEFERSQAVANEVLEQAERKFGMMEKMMDPTAHSLNQFSKAFDDLLNTLKVGVADVIGPIASFLANNMMALTGAVALFAGGLLKQVLPSMSAWKESSQATAKQVQRDQQAVQLRLQRTKRSYEKLKLAQMDSHSAAKKTSAKIVEGTTGGTKSGEGALDFFKGDTDSKKSRAAADKALKHAESQVGLSAKKRTGLLKHQNDQQVKDLRASYSVRSTVHKKGMTDFKFHLKQGGFAIKGFKLQLTSMAATAKVAFAGLASAAATAGKLIGKAFFWVSMLSIAYDGFKMIEEAIYPTDEATKKLAERTENLVSHYKTLHEEISRTIKVMEDYNMLNSQQMIQTRGQALNSIDIPNLIRTINASIDKYPKLEIPIEEYNALMVIANDAANLDKRFAGIGNALAKGQKIIGKSEQDFIKLSNSIQNAGLTIDKLPSKIAAMNADFTALTGKMKPDFGAALILSTQAVIDGTKIAGFAMFKELKREQLKFNKFVKDNATAIDTGKFFDASEHGTSGMEGGQRETYEQYLRLNEQLEMGKKTNVENVALVKNLQDFVTGLTGKQTILNKLESEQLEAKRIASGMMTQGITIQQKMINLNAQNVVLAKSTNKEQMQMIVLKQRERVFLDEEGNIQEDLTDLQVEKLEGFRKQIKAQVVVLQIAEDTRDLALNANAVALNELTYQQKIVNQMQKRLNLANSIADAALTLKRVQSGATGLMGQERGAAGVRAEYAVMLAKQKAAKQELKDRKEIYNLEEGQFGAGIGTQKDLAEAMIGKDNSQNKLNAINLEVELYERRHELAMLNVKADTESARLKLQSISMNPAMTAFNVKMNELKAKNIYYNDEEQAFLYEQIKAQTILAKMAENKQALFEGIASSLSNAFTSIVTGTSSAKEAFKSMAISILSQISSMIAQMMIMRILMSAFGMGASTPMDNQSPMPTPGMFNTEPRFARNGGIFSGNKKTQGYAAGGVGRGSTSGYPAVLHGTEAVVPLPNGKSIPVDMGKSGGTSNNNIVVNISTDGQSSNQGSTGPDMDKLGNAVAAAVQIELHNQKRSGGILNPYGAA